jgi:glycosyltransferase involved in cell wall biosynthesis
MISVIIPAHNECTVIARSLSAITAGAEPEQIVVIVVCNGCSDDTAAVAREFGPLVRVIETEIGSKIHALNLGDQAASTFPRIYVDADVVVTYGTIRALAARLEQGDVMAVAPRPNINLNGCSWFVRAFYEVRSRLPSAREGIGGSGVYGISSAGRRRFGQFPDVVSDDGFIRIQFKSQERETLSYVNSVVFAPRKIGDLIRIRMRSYYGTMELERRFPEDWRNSGESNHRSLLHLLRLPSLWFKLLIYVYVNLAARYKALARVRESTFHWERDHSSREAIAEL